MFLWIKGCSDFFFFCELGSFFKKFVHLILVLFISMKAIIFSVFALFSGCVVMSSLSFLVLEVYLFSFD